MNLHQNNLYSIKDWKSSEKIMFPASRKERTTWSTLQFTAMNICNISRQFSILAIIGIFASCICISWPLNMLNLAALFNVWIWNQFYRVLPRMYIFTYLTCSSSLMLFVAPFVFAMQEMILIMYLAILIA